jgi:hypothetical protein
LPRLRLGALGLHSRRERGIDRAKRFERSESRRSRSRISRKGFEDEIIVHYLTATCASRRDSQFLCVTSDLERVLARRNRGHRLVQQFPELDHQDLAQRRLEGFWTCHDVQPHFVGAFGLGRGNGAGCK